MRNPWLEEAKGFGKGNEEGCLYSKTLFVNVNVDI